MRFRIAVLALLPLLVIGLTAPAASANRPRHAGAPYSYTFDPGQACDFPVQWSGIDDTTFTPRPDGSTVTKGYYDFKVTNLTNGKHFFHVASGPGVFGPLGKVLYARGRWIVQVPPLHGHKARLVMVTGHFDISLITGTIYNASPGTTFVNLCRKIA